MNTVAQTALRGRQLESRAGYDAWLLVITLCLCVCGAIFVMTSSSAHSNVEYHDTMTIFWNHLGRMGWGLLVMLIVSFIDYHWWQRLARPLIVVAVTLLLAVYFVPQAHGVTAKRWINLAGFSFQPAELAKFALITYLAMRFHRMNDDTYADSRPRVFKGGWIITGLILALVAPETNLSMAVLIFATAALMFYFAEIPVKPLLLPAGIAVVLLALLAWLTPYMRMRLTSFVAGILDPMNSSYHVRQSLIGIGQGGIAGVGLGGSTQKNFFLPEPYNDFIFSIVGEELGIFGAVGLLLIFAAFFARAWRIAKQAPDDFGYFLAVGIVCTLGVSLVVNVGVTLGLVPPTGQPLPFISYGGSSLMMSLGAVGVLLNISRQSLQKDSAESTLFIE